MISGPWAQFGEEMRLGLKKGVLFRVIRGICEYPRIESSFYPIATFDDNAMPICVNEIVIKDGFPLCMESLPVTVSE